MFGHHSEEGFASGREAIKMGPNCNAGLSGKDGMGRLGVHISICLVRMEYGESEKELTGGHQPSDARRTRNSSLFSNPLDISAFLRKARPKGSCTAKTTVYYRRELSLSYSIQPRRCEVRRSWTCWKRSSSFWPSRKNLDRFPMQRHRSAIYGCTWKGHQTY